MPQLELSERGLSPVETPEEYEAAWPDGGREVEGVGRGRARARSSTLGGLYVLGTERHDSRRIDNQLRGRSGRQGDPGESRFYLSLGDDLMRLFNGAAVETIMDTLNIPDDVPIESKMVTRAIRSAQTQVEQQNFEIRKNVLKYDEVLNKQRTVIYAERRRVLHGEDLHEQVRNMVDDVIRGYVEARDRRGLRRGVGPRGALDGAQDALPGRRHDRADRRSERRWPRRAQRGVPRRGADRRRAGCLRPARRESRHAARRREPIMRELERRVVLSVLDRKWREHLYEMDYLQEGIQLRSYGQRDPLVEYQREGFTMFTTMMDAIKEESVRLLFNLEVQVAAPEPPPASVPATDEPSTPDTAAPATPAPARKTVAQEVAGAADGAGHGTPHLVAPGLQEPRRPTRLQYSAPTIDGDAGQPCAAGVGRPGRRRRARRST